MLEKRIELRRLKNNIEDYLLLEKWYKNENVNRYFEQRTLTLDEVIKKYKPRTKENSVIKGYMIMSFNVPVGIIQYQEMDTEEIKLFGLENYKNIYEIDMFIGENNLYGKGIGNAALNIMLDIVFKTRAKTIILCVQTENLRAIRCYEKTGFKIVKQISRIDGVGNNQENYLMILEK